MNATCLPALPIEAAAYVALQREMHDTDILRATAPAEMVGRLQENASILEGLLQQTRRISLDLRPPLLDDLGLVPALRWYVDQQAERARLHAKFLPDHLVDNIPPHIETACFRLAQEAITNVVRHGQAKKLTVELERADNSLRLVVRDDGAGFDAIKAGAHAGHGASLGLLGMKERAALAGGTADIVSSLGHGTTVEVLLPLNGSG
jgi:signal transduction histidine kinase